MVIRVNSQVAMVEGVTLEISAEIEGFVIEKEGEEGVTGTDRRESHMAIRDIMRAARPQRP